MVGELGAHMLLHWGCWDKSYVSGLGRQSEYGIGGLTLCRNAVPGDRLFHYFQHLDGLCRGRDLVFVVVQDVEASSPVSLETGITDGHCDIGAFARRE